MKAIVFDKIGSPEEVLSYEDLPMPKAGRGEILVRMTGASVNPGDFLFIQNLYPDPKKPVFPKQIAGNHGAGIVESVGEGATILPGTHVVFSYYNTWAEYAVVPEEWLIPVPDTYPLEKAAQFLNMITAWDLLHMARLNKGQWLLITAGNSNVSTILLQFAKRKGIRVISVVRNKRKEIDLKKMGADVVLESSELQDNAVQKIKKITEGSGVHAIVDNVGGPLFPEFIRSTHFGARVVLNGGLDDRSYSIHNNDLYLNGLEILPHIYRYFFTPPAKEDFTFLNEIIEISHSSDFMVPVAGVVSLQDALKAVQKASSGTSGGKYILQMNFLDEKQ